MCGEIEWMITAAQTIGKWDLLREGSGGSGSGGGGSSDPRTKLCYLKEEELLEELIDRGIIHEVGGLPVETNTIGENDWLWWQTGKEFVNLTKFKNPQFIADPSPHNLCMLPCLFLTTSL